MAVLTAKKHLAGSGAEWGFWGKLFVSEAEWGFQGNLFG